MNGASAGLRLQQAARSELPLSSGLAALYFLFPKPEPRGNTLQFRTHVLPSPELT